MTHDPHRLGAALAFADHAVDDTPKAPWQPLSARLREDAIRDRVQQVARALRTGAAPVDLRTAASTEHFGLAARLVAAQLCARALGIGASPAVEHVWWRQPPGGLVQLSLASTGTTGTASRAASGTASDTAVEALTTVIQRLYAVSAHVLWGNVGSAANSTLSLLRTTRPDLLPAARRAADELLSDPRIDGGLLRSGPDFRRRSCCLIYRAGTALCGDCVLRH